MSCQTIVLVFFVCINVSFGQTLVLLPNITKLSSSLGSSVVFTCLLSFGNESPKISFPLNWIDRNYFIFTATDGRVYVQDGPNLKKLYITRITESDAGDYRCRSRISGRWQEKLIELAVFIGLRSYENQSNVEYIWAGKTRNITCSASSVPEPIFEWLRKGSLIRNNDTYQVFSLGWSSYLQIRVRVVDQSWIYGPYICRVRNNLGEKETTINLERASPPDVPKSVVLVIASPTSVVLRAIPPEEDGGMPVFGYRVEYEDKVKEFSLNDEISIDGLRPKTTYTFKVRAKNEVGAGYGLERTVVTDAISHTIELLPADAKVSLPLGSSVVFTCLVSFWIKTPKDSIPLYWLDRNNFLLTATDGRVYVQDQPNLKKLHVTRITESDAGEYRCRSRISGHWQQKSIELAVFMHITFDNVPEFQYPVINTNALILCKVRAIPEPTVSWLFNFIQIRYGERHVKEANGLMIHAIRDSDSGIYTCRAEIDEDGRFGERRIRVAVQHADAVNHPDMDLTIVGTAGMPETWSLYTILCTAIAIVQCSW